MGLGTFIVSSIYPLVLFDSGASRSFVSFTFSKILDVSIANLDHFIKVEIYDD